MILPKDPFHGSLSSVKMINIHGVKQWVLVYEDGYCFEIVHGNGLGVIIDYSEVETEDTMERVSAMENLHKSANNG